MAARLKSIRIQNYRSLADVSLDLGPVNVLFGPSGAGKSSLLDALGFVRDCVFRGVEAPSAERGQGIGLLFDGAAPGEPIRLKLTTEQLEYELTLSRSAGRIDPLAGERLHLLDRQRILLERRAGTATSHLFDARTNQTTPIELREPTKLSVDRFLDSSQEGSFETLELMKFLVSGRVYHSRSLNFSFLKEFGSSTNFDHWLMESGSNLWSTLSILESRRQLDDRYETIMRYMAETFPLFRGIVIDRTGPNVLYASFLEKGKRTPTLAAGISDGHLQFLILLTVLFFEDRERSTLVLFDEPEASLHPWALAVLAKAIREATESWGRQVILATHSPALISQFDPNQQLAVESKGGRTQITRVSELSDILTGGFDFVVLIDDLEHDFRDQADAVFQRYRTALDTILGPAGLSSRASVHFLVNMLEAYYFAHAEAINAVLGTALADFQGDVETIRHPKNELKKHHPGFDEIRHGRAIIERLDVPRVLSNPETCRSLRTLFGWCSRAIGREFTDVYQLASGSYFDVTRPQIDALPGAPMV